MSVRDSFLNGSALKIEKVHIKEAGADVHIKQLDGTMRSKMLDVWRKLSDASQHDQFVKFQLPLIISLVCEEDGKPSFTEADIPELGNRNSRALDELAIAVMRVAKLLPDSVEQAEKNS